MFVFLLALLAVGLPLLVVDLPRWEQALGGLRLAPYYALVGAGLRLLRFRGVRALLPCIFLLPLPPSVI